MKISNIYAVYFSPVGSTGDITGYVAARAAAYLTVACVKKPEVRTIDFTLPENRKEKIVFGREDLVIFGTPTYAGRIPNKALPFVKELFFGQGTPVVCVATFGNRNYDEVLKEQTTVLRENGFIPVAAGAFGASHVMSDGISPVKRPDAEDLSMAADLAVKAVQKLMAAPKDVEGRDLADELGALDLGEPGPYYVPLGEDGQPVKFLKAKPLTDTEKCDGCGICAAKCPMGSIDKEDVTNVPGICIKCQSCVRRCPNEAKYFDDESMLSHIRMLEEECSKRRAPSEIFY